MLVSIKSLKGLGVFGNFSATAELPEFKRFNLIYGENGSGKTTLSRLFNCLGSGAHPEYPDLGYAIETGSGKVTVSQKYARKVRVFNSDYVEANIGKIDGPLKHILIVGEENKALAEKVRQDQAVYDSREKLIAAETKAYEKLEQERGKIFSTIASTISEAIAGSKLRKYRKPEAEAAFAKLKNFPTYTDAELEAHRATLKQEQAEIIPEIRVPTVRLSPQTEPSELAVAANQITTDATSITQRTAQAEVLQRLAEHADISAWVESGVEIHKRINSERCEFCDQSLPAERMEILARHFSVEDQKLKSEIETVQDQLNIFVSALALTLPSKSSFYKELRDEYEAECQKCETAQNELLSRTDKLASILATKLIQRTKAYTVSSSLEPASFISALEKIGEIIARHNKKTDGFETEKAVAGAALETYYLSTIADQIAEFDASIGAKKMEIKGLTDGAPGLDDPRGLGEILQSITTNKAKVSNAHAGGAEMTQKLASFLGRTDITFESSDAGYLVRRRDKPAKSLSEGEKTAIAFLYFLVQLGDQDFDLAEGVVVIDDPISSLDASSIYQAFAFLKNAVKNAKQVFLFTHNFDFLKLLINWLEHAKSNKALFMIVCAETPEGRDARLVALDPLLEKHPTEYHYLFKLLYSFKSEGTIASCYHLPNVARKVLETFLEFHVPSTGGIYPKLEKTKFDETKKTAIYKFANDLSHRTGKGFDPALIAETQKNATYLLEMIKELAPLHYEGLEKLAQP